MDVQQILWAYRTVTRQLLVLESAVPGLRQMNELWYFLNNGRPDGLSSTARYILYQYRSLLAEQEQQRQRLCEYGLASWASAVEGETALDWQHELQNIGTELFERMPPLPEFSTLTNMLHVA